MLNRTLTAHYVRRALSWAIAAGVIGVVVVFVLLLTAYLAAETQ